MMEKRKTAVLIALAFAGLCIGTALAQDTTATQCDRIGNAEAGNQARRASRDERFYLDEDNPAPCHGNVTSWRVCYYGPGATLAATSTFYWATYAVYRPEVDSDGDLVYRRVSEIYRAIRYANSLINAPEVDGPVQPFGFACYDDLIDVGDNPFTIQAGDVIGACVFNPDGNDNIIKDILTTRRELDVVGETDTDSESLLEMDDDGCDIDELPSNVERDDLLTISSRRLHIKANIDNTKMIVSTATTAFQFQTSSSPMTHTTDTAATTVTPTTSTPPTSAAVVFPSPTGRAVPIDVTTTDDGTTTFSDAPAPSRPNGAQPGLPTSVVVVITVIITLTLVTMVAALAIYIRLLLHRRREKDSTDKTTQPFMVLDNVAYGDNLVSRVLEESTTLYSTYEQPVGRSDELEGPQSPQTYKEQNLSESTINGSSLYDYVTVGPNDETTSTPEQPIKEADLAHYEECNVTIPYSTLLEKNKEEDIYEHVKKYAQPSRTENELYAQIKDSGITDISAQSIQIKGHLGSGQFGFVEKGVWLRNGSSSLEVALKTLSERSSELDKVKFLQEAAIMAQFRHPNVVTLYGVVSKTEPLMLVVELIHKGDLKKHLATLRPDLGELPAGALPDTLLSFSQQVALGMQYLSAKGFVHRDLAARNVLVSNSNECKIADFGMSRDLADDTYYVSKGGMIPIKWTAPEAISYKKYSTASDVWSYGCLLYEIWSLGRKPYEGLTNIEVVRLVNAGKRLSSPPGCPSAIYELMIKCWNPNAANRPRFREILLSLVENSDRVLAIPQEALKTHHLAGVLGSPLKAGNEMYTYLRDGYTAISNH